MPSLDDDGFQILAGIVNAPACDDLIEQLQAALAEDEDSTIGSRGRSNRVVGSRNLIDHWTGWRRITELSPVQSFVQQHVGASAGLVRILYFDKPPGQGWALAMHRDKTIAVVRHHSPAPPFAKPTTKAGVPHVEATEDLLSRMLTLRIHLDAMTSENGPLTVIPGSHVVEFEPTQSIQTIHCNRGDLFAMRPLLLHGSLPADPKTQMHRRVIHLEIGPEQDLPSPYQWHRYHAMRNLSG